MASAIVDIILGAIQLISWIVWDFAPALCFFTAFAVVFAVTLGKVTVEFPAKLTKIGWTGIPRITRSPQGRTILSPALGVIVGFIIWAVIAGAAIMVHAYRS